MLFHHFETSISNAAFYASVRLEFLNRIVDAADGTLSDASPTQSDVRFQDPVRLYPTAGMGALTGRSFVGIL